MIAEFAGLPGSGKSTGARYVLSKHFIKRSRIESTLSLLFWNLVFLIRHPIRSAKLFVYILRYSGGTKLFYYKFTNLFLHANGKHMKAKFLRRAIIDQGFVQNCISLFEHVASIEEISSYLRLAPLPDQMIVFDTSYHIREERMSKREFTVRDAFDPEYKSEYKEIAEKNWATLLKVLPQFVENIVMLKEGKEEEGLKEIFEQKKIIYLANFRLPTEKAHGLQIAKMSEAMADQGFEVTLVTPTKKHNPIKEDMFAYYDLKKNFKVDKIYTPDFFAFRIFPSSFRFFLQSAWFAFVMLFRKIDHEAIYYLRNPELVPILKLRGATRVIFEAHMLPKKKRLYRTCVKLADLIPCNSRGTMKALEALGISRLMLAPNGVDLEAFRNAPEKNVARESLGLPIDKKIVLYSGHLYAWKGVQTLLDAAKLNMDLDKIFYLIGGKKNEIEKFVKDMKLEGVPSIVFREHVPHAEVYSYLVAADVLVLPNSSASEESISFTSPIKMFEYMASGVPIIASDLPSIKEILSDDTAVFFQPDNAGDLLDKVNWVLNNKREGECLAQAAKEMSKKYSWRNRAVRILEN